jgi:hypothetical protein
MALVLLKLQLEGVEVEPYVRVVQNRMEIFRAALRWSDGLLKLGRLSAIGFDVSQDGSLEILVNSGISGDSLLGSLSFHAILSPTLHGRLECLGIGLPGVQISFDYVYQPLVRIYLVPPRRHRHATPVEAPPPAAVLRLRSS